MRKFFTTFGLFLITYFSFAQETKYVDTELLNVRSGAGNKFEVIDKIARGEKVTTYSIKGTWTEIELDNGTRGYVSSKFLSDEKNIEKSSGKEKKNSWLYLLLLVGILLIGFFSKGGSSRSSKSKYVKRFCKYCGKVYHTSQYNTSVKGCNQAMDKTHRPA